MPNARAREVKVANYTKLTVKKKATFCDSLILTGGNVTQAAALIDVSRSGCYKHRDADSDFAIQWDESVEAGTEKLEQEVLRRAQEGVLEPQFYKGAECGYVRKYSDTLAMFLLKGRKPNKYRERSQIEHTGEGGGPVQFIMLPEGSNGNGNGKQKPKDG